MNVYNSVQKSQISVESLDKNFLYKEPAKPVLVGLQIPQNLNNITKDERDKIKKLERAVNLLNENTSKISESVIHFVDPMIKKIKEGRNQIIQSFDEDLMDGSERVNTEKKSGTGSTSLDRESESSLVGESLENPQLDNRGQREASAGEKNDISSELKLIIDEKVSMVKEVLNVIRSNHELNEIWNDIITDQLSDDQKTSSVNKSSFFKKYFNKNHIDLNIDKIFKGTLFVIENVSKLIGLQYEIKQFQTAESRLHNLLDSYSEKRKELETVKIKVDNNIEDIVSKSKSLKKELKRRIEVDEQNNLTGEGLSFEEESLRNGFFYNFHRKVKKKLEKIETIVFDKNKKHFTNFKEIKKDLYEIESQIAKTILEIRSIEKFKLAKGDYKLTNDEISRINYKIDTMVVKSPLDVFSYRNSDQIDDQIYRDLNGMIDEKIIHRGSEIRHKKEIEIEKKAAKKTDGHIKDSKYMS